MVGRCIHHVRTYFSGRIGLFTGATGLLTHLGLPFPGPHASPHHFLERITFSTARFRQGRLGDLEAVMRPTFDAMPKNSAGNLEHAAASYVLHRLFVQRHGPLARFWRRPAGGKKEKGEGRFRVVFYVWFAVVFSRFWFCTVCMGMYGVVWFCVGVKAP